MLELPLERGIALIDRAMEREQEERIWQVWLARLPQMDKRSYISFEDFRRKLMKPPSGPLASPQDIIRSAERIKAADRLRKGR